ncbi:MAG: peptide chain release factor 1 [Oscillospiraceae bacterium]|nr:peptide chain release factor 1 [Oscillospiraceae bacterium]
MLDKLKQIARKYSEIRERMEDPALYADPAAYTKLAREQKELEPIALAYQAYDQAQKDAESAKALLSDPEMKQIAQEEYDDARRRMTALEDQLRRMLIPRDPDDDKNVILEIRGGVGGEEAALFGYDLYRMYTMYAESRGWRCEILSLNETELGGMKEVVFLVEGDGAYARLKYESGVHRVQRVPDTEASGRIQTSAVTVAVLPEMDQVDFSINPADLKIDTYRSSGAGGQHINKTESAIRITHLPTGMVVECQDERSQYKNKDRAMKILASRLYELERQKQVDAQAAQRKSQVGSGDRSERIRTYNFPQGRVTDHRINLTLYKIDQIMNGDLDELIDALIIADQAEKLRQESEQS